MTLDLKVFFFFNNLAGKWPFFDKTVIFFADHFEYFAVAAFLVFVVFSAYSRREKLRISLVAAISVIISRGIITEIIRYFYHRPRPFSVYPIIQLVTDTHYSFPSGHAAFFFALAIAIYFYNKKWGIGFFAAAILMTLARVIAGVHYPSDILGGAVIGILSAWIVFNVFQKHKTSALG